MSTPQEQGRQFEKNWAEKVGGKTSPGSGNQWFCRMDVDDRQVLWSCKSTTNKSYRLSQDDLDEVADAVDAPGGKGGESIPAMAIEIGDSSHDVVVLRADDFLKLVQEDIKFVRPDKSEEKRQNSRVPLLFKEG